MKRIVLTLIIFYKRFVSIVLRQLFGIRHVCRYDVSCSSFAEKAIEKYGVIHGGTFAVKRIFTCHPFAKPYDPVI